MVVMVDLVVEVVEEIELLELDLVDQVILLQLVPHKEQMAEGENVNLLHQKIMVVAEEELLE